MVGVGVREHKRQLRKRLGAGLLCLAVLFLMSACTNQVATEAPTTSIAAANATPEKPQIEPFPSQETPTVKDTAADEPEWEKTIWIATDIHYLAGELKGGGTRFQSMVDHGDGKVVTYVEEILDAFLEEVVVKQPDLLILSGDLTLEGEKKSHQELAEKLRTVQNAGVPILVIPGNHDINNSRAARYVGGDRFPEPFTTPDEFLEIYREFGYEDAISRDATTLSYVYQLDEETRFLMLDTCQYQGRPKVGGVILSETYDWIEGQLEDAWEQDYKMIPVAHHNLLEQSEIYVEDCTIEHSQQLITLLENWDVTLFLSGHLHVQHAKSSEEDYGIWEMVTSSLSTPSCQYGVLKFRSDSSFLYETRSVDVEKWAFEQGQTSVDLLEFDKFKEPFLRRVFYNQSYDALEKITSLDEDQRIDMSEFYSNLNYLYYQGRAYEIRDSVKHSLQYQLWMEDGFLTVLGDYVQYIIEDAQRDYNRVEEK